MHFWPLNRSRYISAERATNPVGHAFPLLHMPPGHTFHRPHMNENETCMVIQMACTLPPGRKLQMAIHVHEWPYITDGCTLEMVVHHTCLPAMHAPLPCMPPCHACPPPCMPPAMHAPCHACTPCHACLPCTPHHTYPLPCMPSCHAYLPPHMPPATHTPTMHAPAITCPCHACPLPCIPPAMHAPTMHTPLPARPPCGQTDTCKNITFANFVTAKGALLGYVQWRIQNFSESATTPTGSTKLLFGQISPKTEREWKSVVIQMIVNYRWSNITDGRTLQMDEHYRWSYITDGRTLQMVIHYRWLHITDSHALQMVVHYKWS